MSNNSSNHSGGIGFAGALLLLFIALKLTGFIAWSWWWVMSPLWISLVIVILVMALYLFILVRNRKTPNERLQSAVERARRRGQA